MISYILAAYRGARETQEAPYTVDPNHYLRRHLQSLERLQHDLGEIVVVLNEDNDEIPIDLPSTVRDTPVVYSRRPNRGLSYGAFEHGVHMARYESAIFMEDDYVFAVDGFDEILAAKLASQEKPGFCCGALELRSDGHPLGGAVFLGIANVEATKKILEIGYDGNPIVREDNSRDSGWYSQVAWSRSYMVAGYGLTDWLDTSFGCATWVSERHMAVWYDEQLRPGHFPMLNPRVTPHATEGIRNQPVVIGARRGVVVGRSHPRAQLVGQRNAPRAVATGTPTRAAIPEHAKSRRSLVVPQQALDRSVVDVQIGPRLYEAALGEDGQLR